MTFRIGDDFLGYLIEKDLIPDDTIAVNLSLRVGEIPVMTVERMPPAEDIELFLEAIASTEELQR